MGTQGQEKVNLIIPVILLILAVALSVVIYYISAYYNSEIKSDELDVTSKVIPIKSKLNSAQQEAALNSCDTKSTINQKDWCYLDIAKNDFVNGCNNIVQPHFKNYCMAIIESSATYCELIEQSTVKDACYITVAQNTKNEKLCSNTSKEEYCLTLIA